jgi:uncharacterized membrane protein YuzA (DUF378 family)|tara:strand:+ start:412 stop:678 length:267 start_codon:yes stop_codon:yes gene_type:complete
MTRSEKRVGSADINQIGEVTNMETVQMIGIILAAIGALNWGLVGLFKFDLVAFITGGNSFGKVNLLSRSIYVIVAAAGVVATTAITQI